MLLIAKLPDSQCIKTSAPIRLEYIKILFLHYDLGSTLVIRAKHIYFPSQFKKEDMQFVNKHLWKLINLNSF